jgi:hypothetical protein
LVADAELDELLLLREDALRALDELAVERLLDDLLPDARLLEDLLPDARLPEARLLDDRLPDPLLDDLVRDELDRFFAPPLDLPVLRRSAMGSPSCPANCGVTVPANRDYLTS